MNNYMQPKMYRIVPRNVASDPVKCVGTLMPVHVASVGDAYMRVTPYVIKLVRA